MELCNHFSTLASSLTPRRNNFLQARKHAPRFEQLSLAKFRVFHGHFDNVRHVSFGFYIMLSSSLCRIWTCESKICTGLQSRKLAEAIFTFFNVEASRKCFLQEFVMLSFAFALENMQEMYCNGFDNVRHVYAIS